MHTRVARLFLVLALAAPLVATGCQPADTEYEMDEWIEMGPFVFSIHRASGRLNPASGGRPRIRTVSVGLRVDLERSASAKIKFDDFLNDMADGGMVVFPAAKLLDPEGNEFDGLVHRVSGRTRWKIDFDLLILRRGMGSAEDFLELRTSDLRLRIRNLDRRKGQPAVAVVQLR